MGAVGGDASLPNLLGVLFCWVWSTRLVRVGAVGGGMLLYLICIRLREHVDLPVSYLR